MSRRWTIGAAGFGHDLIRVRSAHAENGASGVLGLLGRGPAYRSADLRDWCCDLVARHKGGRVVVLTDSVIAVAMFFMIALGLVGFMANAFKRSLMRLFGLTYWEVRIDGGPPVRFKKKPGIYEGVAAAIDAKEAATAARKG